VSLTGFVVKNVFFGEIMKTNRIFYLTVLAAVCLFANGCNEEMSSDQLLQARLVGNENLELKKQIKDKDSQINDLNKQLEQAKQEAKQQIALAQRQIKEKDDRIADLTKQAEQNRQVIAQMQDASIQIQKHFDATLTEYKQKLENYEKAAIAAPTPCPEVEKQYETLYNDIMTLLSECQTKLEKYEGAEHSTVESTEQKARQNKQ
jgi:septal ring factor EnvC (AmiA/AmiB activator)